MVVLLQFADKELDDFLKHKVALHFATGHGARSEAHAVEVEQDVTAADALAEAKEAAHISLAEADSEADSDAPE